MSATRPLLSTIVAGMLAIGIAASASAQTPEPIDPPKDPLADIQKSVVAAIEKGLNLLSVAIGTVVPYKMPEILPNGDIIIRYSPPPPPDAPAEPEESQKI